MTTIGNSTPQRPECFGNPECWDPDTADCAGESDPAGNTVNDKEECAFFRSCGVRANNAKFEAARTGFTQQRVIPVQELHRRPSFMQGSHTPSVTSPPQVTTTRPTPTVLPAASPPRPTYGAVHSAQVMQQQGYAVPGFLTVAEERYDDEHVMSYIARYALRSALKGAAQGLSHLFDTTIFKRRPPP